MSASRAVSCTMGVPIGSALRKVGKVPPSGSSSNCGAMSFSSRMLMKTMVKASVRVERLPREPIVRILEHVVPSASSVTRVLTVPVSGSTANKFVSPDCTYDFFSRCVIFDRCDLPWNFNFNSFELTLISYMTTPPVGSTACSSVFISQWSRTLPTGCRVRLIGLRLCRGNARYCRKRLCRKILFRKSRGIELFAWFSRRNLCR